MASTLPPRPPTLEAPCDLTVISSRYHEALVEGLLAQFRRELHLLSADTKADYFTVPGAFEIPVAVQEAASRLPCDAVVAFGVIIEGETAHGSLIAHSITDALQRIALKGRLPVIHEVLFVRNEAQARARCLEAAVNRGTEAARTVIGAIQTMRALRASG